MLYISKILCGCIFWVILGIGLRGIARPISNPMLFPSRVPLRKHKAVSKMVALFYKPFSIHRMRLSGRVPNLLYFKISVWAEIHVSTLPYLFPLNCPQQLNRHSLVSSFLWEIIMITSCTQWKIPKCLTFRISGSWGWWWTLWGPACEWDSASNTAISKTKSSYMLTC